MTSSMKLICKYIEQSWFEWKSQLDVNFNMKNMKIIINISIKIPKCQNYRFRFSVPVLCIFNCLMIWKFQCYVKFVKTLPESTVFNFFLWPIKWCCSRLLLMFRFSKAIKIIVLCANLVEIGYYDVSKRSQSLS